MGQLWKRFEGRAILTKLVYADENFRALRDFDQFRFAHVDNDRIKFQIISPWFMFPVFYTFKHFG